eukprot:162545-Amorphochlora_amoeboformis.AAC.1
MGLNPHQLLRKQAFVEEKEIPPPLTLALAALSHARRSLEAVKNKLGPHGTYLERPLQHVYEAQIHLQGFV